jgi:hypothetical protein
MIYKKKENQILRGKREQLIFTSNSFKDERSSGFILRHDFTNLRNVAGKLGESRLIIVSIFS